MGTLKKGARYSGDPKSCRSTAAKRDLLILDNRRNPAVRMRANELP
ncbi:MAG: hypothetical protein AAFN79_11330 [Pseudomonadota bacterium]